MTGFTNSHDALSNRLLAALPTEDFARLQTEFEAVDLPLGQVIYEPGERMDYVYFPTTALISMLYTTRDGATSEIGIHGNDGAVGIAVFMGGDSMPHQAVVIVGGKALRMKADSVRREFARGGHFQFLLLRFTLSLITQISQTAVCNRFHSVEQHLCRWLLHSSARLQSNQIVMTHDLIAGMLGVRREGVSVAARKLQDRKFIAYSRGTITILDRQSLEQCVCECYQVARDEYEQLLGGQPRVSRSAE